MSDTPFMPGWAWGLAAAVFVGSMGLLAFSGSESRHRRPGSWKGLTRTILRPDDPRQARQMFWPNVDKARILAEEAQSALNRGNRLMAQRLLREARSALRVASRYSHGPHTESILRLRHGLVDDLEVEALARI